MVNDIIQGIAAAVTTVKNVEFYDSEAEQDFDPPCFFVQTLEFNQTPEPNARQRWMQPFDVLYFPAEDENRPELYEYAEQLVQALNIITLPSGRKLHGSSIRYQIQGGNLHVFVSYNVLLAPVDVPAETMGSLQQTEFVKG